MLLKPLGTAQADGAQVFIEGVLVCLTATLPAYPVRNELRTRLLQGAPDAFNGHWGNTYALVEAFDAPDGDNRDVGALGQVGLLKPHQGAGRTDLFG